MPAFIDPTGKKFGRLTVTSYDGARCTVRLAGDASDHDGCADHISGALPAFGASGQLFARIDNCRAKVLFEAATGRFF
jgi:hypothetical protein